MNKVTIFWHHVGREHGLGKYTDDLRKNPPEVIKQDLALKMTRAKQSPSSHRYLKIDGNILLELASDSAEEEFLICYLITEGLQFSLNYKKSHPGWLIDLVDIEEVAPHQYCVHDLFIDIAVGASGSYRVVDIEDFVQAIELEILDKEQVVKVLRSLDFIVNKLNSGQFPLDILRPLVKEYAPILQA
jgi:uncharacterized protein